MDYGVKRGVKTPGQFNAADIAGLALASAAGIVSALVVDYNAKGEASAIYKINEWAVALSRLLHVGDIPLWAVALVIIAVGAASIFYFQPITRQGAYAQGFGLLAVLMTAVPADLAGGLEAFAGHELPALPTASEATTTPTSVPGAGTPQPGLIRAAYTTNVQPAVAGASDAQLVRVDNQAGAIYNVRLTITFPNGLPEDVEAMIRKGTLRGRLYNENTKDTFNLFRTAGGAMQRTGNSIVILAGVPASSPTATLWVRVEADKYKIEVRSTKAAVGQPLNWEIRMEPSTTPLVLQRLNNSYWF